MTNLAAFVLVLSLVQLFKRTKRYNKDNKNIKRKKEPKFMFAWWFKIIFYLISFTCIIVSISFTFIKGDTIVFKS